MQNQLLVSNPKEALLGHAISEIFKRFPRNSRSVNNLYLFMIYENCLNINNESYLSDICIKVGFLKHVPGSNKE
jgi:hypothetical protein